jgi:predicted RNA binding protein YcfA (HicA-like mRNA interferase family)
MRYRELTKRLRELGCEYLRDAPGLHELGRNPQTGDTTIIARHEGREIPTGTFHSILRDLGISYQDFQRRGGNNYERLHRKTSDR